MLLVAKAIFSPVNRRSCTGLKYADTSSFLNRFVGRGNDGQAQSMVDAYISNMASALPSIIIGEVAGMIAKEIYSVLSGIVNAFQR